MEWELCMKWGAGTIMLQREIGHSWIVMDSLMRKSEREGGGIHKMQFSFLLKFQIRSSIIFDGQLLSTLGHHMVQLSKEPTWAMKWWSFSLFSPPFFYLIIFMLSMCHSLFPSCSRAVMSHHPSQDSCQTWKHKKGRRAIEQVWSRKLFTLPSHAIAASLLGPFQGIKMQAFLQ